MLNFYSPENYKFRIRKTEKREYVLSLIKEPVLKGKGGLCDCTSKNKKSNSILIRSVTLTNNDLSIITERLISTNGNHNYKIVDFIEVNTGKFVKELKKLTNIGLEDDNNF